MDAKPLSDAEIAELERLEKAATKAPWLPCEAKYGPAITSVEPLPDDYEDSEATPEQQDIAWVFGVSVDAEPIISDADKKLVCVLRNLLPRLLAELRERRAADIECSRADCDRRATTFDFRGRDVCDEHK